MVGYGKSIVKAQRVGWEGAYLDYDGLKGLAAEIELHLVQNHRNGNRNRNNQHGGTTQRVEQLKQQFFCRLQSQIEKMSLFLIQQQGVLAQAVGALRFQGSTENVFAVPGGSNNAKWRSPNEILNRYAALGTELLHLLRYVCINSIGIRKILKKYNKVFETTMDQPHCYAVSGDHLQQFVNSNFVMAIQSSLQTALTEAYHNRMTDVVDDDDNGLSLYRFQCVMECNSTLRRNAYLLQQPFWDFLSRQSMIVTSLNLGGINHGNGKRVLQWLIKLKPEKLLSLELDELVTTSQRMMDKQSRLPTAHHSSPSADHKQDNFVPEVQHRQPLPSILEEIEDIAESSRRDANDRGWGGITSASMILNLSSALLYTINYYIVAPTANHYAISFGADGALGATLIGASSLSAIFAAFLYSLWYTRGTLKSAFLFSTLCPAAGNLMYSMAISFDSLPIAVGGRILCGLGSAEVINRQVISACVDFKGMTKASALFVAAGAIGMSLGPLIAAILDLTTGRTADVDIVVPFLPAGGIIFNHTTSPGFVMAGLWFIQMIALLILFDEPVRINSVDFLTDGDSDSAETAGDDTLNEQDIIAKSSESRSQYGSIHHSSSTGTTPASSSKASNDSWKDELAYTGKLIFANPGFPLTIAIFCFIELTDEVLISSCTMVVHRYFGWHGSVAGFLIASLGALVLPAHFVVENVSRSLSERRILMRAMVAVCLSTIAILNFNGFYYDGLDYAHEIEDGRVEGLSTSSIAGMETKEDEFVYDNSPRRGPFIYIAAMSAIFMSTIVLEGVDTSILAKVTPPELNDQFINGGLLATLVGTLGRILADGLITGSALLDSNTYIDFINATFLPILVLALIGMHLIHTFHDSLVK